MSNLEPDLAFTQLARRNLWPLEKDFFWRPVMARTLVGVRIFMHVEAHCRWMNHA